MTTRWFLGLSSGSSADGVDAALIETEGIGLDLRVRLLHALHQPYPPDLRELIVRGATGGESADTRLVSQLHRLLAETFAVTLRQVADQASFSLQRAQSIGCAGHTIWNDPEGRFPSLLVLGMPAVIAERTGVTVVSDFRFRDLAAGGQGVPLSALVHHLLFRHPSEGRLLIHLGGIACVVYLPPGGRLPEIVGFEAAPCNVFLDALMSQITHGRESYDAGGKYAVQGRCVDSLLQRWFSSPQLLRRPPRSLPRHAFGASFAANAVREAQSQGVGPYDLLCSASHFVAQAVAGAVRKFLPREGRIDRILLSGGGARNGLLWALLAQALQGPPLERTDAAGVPGDALKAVESAVLAALTLDGVPANIPSATGAVASRLLGSLTPGSSANWARCLSWMAAQTVHLTRQEHD